MFKVHSKQRFGARKIGRMHLERVTTQEIETELASRQREKAIEGIFGPKRQINVLASIMNWASYEMPERLCFSAAVCKKEFSNFKPQSVSRAMRKLAAKGKLVRVSPGIFKLPTAQLN